MLFLTSEAALGSLCALYGFVAITTAPIVLYSYFYVAPQLATDQQQTKTLAKWLTGVAVAAFTRWLEALILVTHGGGDWFKNLDFGGAVGMYFLDATSLWFLFAAKFLIAIVWMTLLTSSDGETLNAESRHRVKIITALVCLFYFLGICLADAVDINYRDDNRGSWIAKHVTDASAVYDAAELFKAIWYWGLCLGCAIYGIKIVRALHARPRSNLALDQRFQTTPLQVAAVIALLSFAGRGCMFVTYIYKSTEHEPFLRSDPVGAVIWEVCLNVFPEIIFTGATFSRVHSKLLSHRRASVQMHSSSMHYSRLGGQSPARGTGTRGSGASDMNIASSPMRL